MANFSDCVNKHTNEENIGNGLQVLSKELRIVSHGQLILNDFGKQGTETLKHSSKSFPAKTPLN